MPLPKIADAIKQRNGRLMLAAVSSTDAITATNMKGALTDGEVEDYKVSSQLNLYSI